MELIFTLVFLAVTYVIGHRAEEQHYQSIRAREIAMKDLIAVTFERTPDDWTVERSELVLGTVVISLDYFKRFVAGLRGIVGGRISVFETLLDRARREAILRMKNAAQVGGYDAVINLRLETSRLASSGQKGKGTAGVEILAYGTAVKLKKS